VKIKKLPEKIPAVFHSKRSLITSIS